MLLYTCLMACVSVIHRSCMKVSSSLSSTFLSGVAAFLPRPLPRPTPLPRPAATLARKEARPRPPRTPPRAPRTPPRTPRVPRTPPRPPRFTTRPPWRRPTEADLYSTMSLQISALHCVATNLARGRSAIAVAPFCCGLLVAISIFIGRPSSGTLSYCFIAAINSIVTEVWERGV